jgi:hypothetical protein
VIAPQKRWLPDGTSVLVRSGAYGAVLLATRCVFWDLIFAEFPDEAVSTIVVIVLVVGPAFAWPLSSVWWYRMHRELAAYGRLRNRRIFRMPLLSLIPSLTLVAALMLTIAQHYSGSRFIQSDNAYGVEAILVLVSVLSALIGIYRMAWKPGRLRCQVAPRAAWKAMAAGAGVTVIFFLPAAVVLYFQRSLNRMWREVATTTPTQLTSGKAGAPG